MENKKKGCGCFKYLFFLVVIIFVVTQLVNNGLFASKTPASEIDDISVDDRFYYAQLNTTEKTVYRALLQTAQNGDLTCRLSEVDYDTYVAATNRAAVALSLDHPELFWLNGGWTANGTRGFDSNSDTITIQLGAYAFWDYVSAPQKYIDIFESAVNAVVAQAEKYTNVYDRVEFVHDYIAHNAYYDYDRLEEAKKTMHVASSEYIYSAYSCLVQKATVCAGYAKAFQVIMQRLGYNCTYVRGDAGGAHAWNYIELDDQGYFLDVTWDDADWRTDSGAVRYPNDAKYDYFCITKRELNKTHIEDESLFNIPDPTATKYNYYVYNHYRVQTYNFQTVAAILDDQRDKSVICVQFSSLEQMNKAKADLFDKGKWSRVPSLKGRKISYITDKDHLSFTILKK